MRLLPVSILKGAIKKMNKRGFPATVSFHTWELDPKTPRVRIGFAKSFITYYNLPVTISKIEQLLASFNFTSFRDYLDRSNFN